MRSAARIAAAVGTLLLLPLPGAGQEGRAPDPELRISPDGWGDASVPDIRAVLRSASESFLPRFPGLRLPAIEVSRSRGNPITLYQRGPTGEIRVRLDVEGPFWARFAFQFSHELGHILCGFEDYPNPNLWFEESLCEVASLYGLGRMSESWSRQAPYPNWKDYAPALGKYRDERLDTAREKVPDGTTFEAWFRGKEPQLRKDPHLRAANLTIAAALLPLFEEAPEHWEAVRTLNAAHGNPDRSFPRYLGDWSRSAPERHREFIAKIAGRLGVAVER